MRPAAFGPNAQRRAGGFSLVELLIALALLSILIAFSVPAYLGYVHAADATRVRANFEDALRQARTTFATARAREGAGLPVVPAVPASSEQWIERFNPQNESAPGGGPAYVDGAADAGTGAIGVQTSGDFDAGDATVTVAMPAYADLDPRTEVVAIADL